VGAGLSLHLREKGSALPLLCCREHRGELYEPDIMTKKTIADRQQIYAGMIELGCMYKVPGKGWALTEKGIRWAEESRTTTPIAIPAEIPLSDTRTTGE